MAPQLEARITPKGNLQLIADAECVEHIKDNWDRGEEALLWEMLESYWTNNSFQPTKGVFACWSGPLIQEFPVTPDPMDSPGRFWTFMSYERRLVIEDLIDHSRHYTAFYDLVPED